jgi:hypothetical protein
VQALFYLYMMIPLISFPLAAFLAAAAAGIVGNAVVPRWLGWVALPPVLCLLVGTTGLGNLYGPLETIGYLGGFMPFLLWTLALGVALLARRGAMAPVAGGQMVSTGGERWQPES